MQDVPSVPYVPGAHETQSPLEGRDPGAHARPILRNLLLPESATYIFPELSIVIP